MQHRVTILLACFFFLLSTMFVLRAQSSAVDSVNYPQFRFDGTLKNKYEYVRKTDNSRFSVRNSRLGVFGSITPMADYRAQVELSSEGQFQVLDLFGTLRPYKNLSFDFGQTGIPVFNPYTVSPGAMMFANRTFLAKYYAGTRDIGLVARYNVQRLPIPVGVEFGVFNGNVINSSPWSNRISYSGRLTLGTMQGWRSTIKMYDFPNNGQEDFLIYGADLRYQAPRWRVESEIMWRDDQLEHTTLTSGYLQGAYGFPLNWKMFKNVTPAVRWDAINQINDNKIDVHRLTTSIGFGLTKTLFSSLLRFDYEWYRVNNELDFMNANEEMDASKFTIELVYIF